MCGYGHSTVYSRYDYTRETIESRLAEPICQYCNDLTEKIIGSGHWIAQERSREVKVPNSMMTVNANDLWQRNEGIANACLYHPFVQGIASGRLPLSTFKLYVAQDAFFLEAFARAYALAIAKVPDRAGMLVFKKMLNGVFEELTLHTEYAKRWGIELNSPKPLAFTQNYTDFLLAVAALEPVGHIVAAMVPCMRLYAWLGQKLAPVTDPQSAYVEWVTTYAGEEIEELVTELEGLLERYPGDPTTLENHYRKAMTLEFGFFAGASTSKTEAPL